MNQATPATAQVGQTSTIVRIALGLSVLVLLIYAQTCWFDFVNYDDSECVYGNPHILTGLTSANLVWALTSSHNANWHPLTSYSYMLDIEMFGLKPGMHHLVNVFLHMAAVVVLFLALLRLTRELGPSAFVAALFAVHPLRVESVAWISERKDVLSGLFFALTLLAYAGYARRPSLGRYALVVVAFVLGLLAKPMLVTLPFVLLLLDVWPLRRFVPDGAGRRNATAILLEKLPLLALAAASSAATIWAQTAAFASLDMISPGQRAANAVVSYAAYIRQMFWPFNLAAPYPHPRDQLPVAELIASGILLVVVTAIAIAWRRKRPYVLVGWLWYLGMLVPVIGLVQVGDQARADRYTYLPQIGLYLSLTWLTVETTRSWPQCRLVLGWLAAGLLLVLTCLSWRQARHWRDTTALFQHALDCTSNNLVAHLNLGSDLVQKGRYAEAAGHYERALAISPRSLGGLSGYGGTLIQLGRYDEATAYLLRALEVAPPQTPVLIQLGIAYGHLRRFDEAQTFMRQALEREPGSAATNNALGVLYVQQKKPSQGVEWFEHAVKLEPANNAYRTNLTFALYQSNRLGEALDVLRETIHMRPNDVGVLRFAARIAATSDDITVRSPPEAIAWAERANKLTHGQVPLILDELAICYAAAGRFDDAVRVESRAIESALASESPEVISNLRSHLEHFRSGKLPKTSSPMPE